MEQSSGLEREAIRQEEIEGLVEGKGDSLAKRIEEKRECKRNTGSLGHVFQLRTSSLSVFTVMP